MPQQQQQQPAVAAAPTQPTTAAYGGYPQNYAAAPQVYNKLSLLIQNMHFYGSIENTHILANTNYTVGNFEDIKTAFSLKEDLLNFIISTLINTIYIGIITTKSSQIVRQ